jgi:hypothetical protein
VGERRGAVGSGLAGTLDEIPTPLLEPDFCDDFPPMFSRIAMNWHPLALAASTPSINIEMARLNAMPKASPDPNNSSMP